MLRLRNSSEFVGYRAPQCLHLWNLKASLLEVALSKSKGRQPRNSFDFVSGWGSPGGFRSSATLKILGVTSGDGFIP